MEGKIKNPVTETVALLAEGVDRNHGLPEKVPFTPSRPPRGGRG